MVDIKRLLVATLRGDPALAALMGVTPADPRVYAFYQPTAEISREKKAYITYALTAHPDMTRSAQGSPVYTLMIWGLDWETVEAVGDRLTVLLEEQRLTSAAGRVVHSTRLSENDRFQENTRFAGKVYQFRLAYSKV